MRGARIVACAALVVSVGSLAPAAVGAEPDLLYPVLSPLDNAGGPAADFADAFLNSYSSQAGFANVPGRLIQRLTEPAGSPDLLLQTLIDSTTHARPTLLGVNVSGTGSPYFMPDWNNDGVHGNAADYDIDNSDALAVAPFRYPCIAMDGKVTYETTSATCTPAADTSADFRFGQARKIEIVDSRGLLLAARIWLPHTAIDAVAPPHPAVVFAPGFMSRQADYYSYAMTAARAGYVVLTYDPAGQGDSEGSGFDLSAAPAVPDCIVPGACRDLWDAVRWLVGDAITPVSGGIPRLVPLRDPAYAPAGDNAPNPVLDRIDPARIGIFGQSMGSLATIGYLQTQVRGSDPEGRSLPPVGAATAISGFTKLDAIDVPLQLQTTDYDLPGYDASNGFDATDGPVGTKAWYDDHRATGMGGGALSMFIMESGNHGDTTNFPYGPRALWVLPLSTAYAIDHFDCHLLGDAAACGRATSPRRRLSRIAASEYDVDGPAGPQPSRCITIPDKGSLAQAYHPDVMLASIFGNPPYDCTP
ncbi:MAG: CocE/NonD family hydrolase [Actinomycetota bacterium]